MKYFIHLIWLTAIIASCDTKQGTSDTEIEATPSSYTYLALGDSYTIGEGVSEEERWPNQLADRLTANDMRVEEVKIIAKTGWTTADLLDAVVAENTAKYDLVSLLIGVNNQFQGKSFDLYEVEFDSLIEISIGRAGSKDRVFVVSIPDYGVTPFGSSKRETIARELDRYNAYAEMRCDELGIPFVNITTISRQLGASQGSLASDQLHPSGTQYQKWVDEIFPVAMEILAK